MIHELLAGVLRSGRRPRWRIACATVVGLTGISVMVLPATVAQAAVDSVTNCSGSASTPGSLPYEVANSGPGDTINFLLSPNCTSISMGGTPIVISHDLDINNGNRSGNLAVVGNGTAQIFVVTSGTVDIEGLTIEGGSGGIFNQGTLGLTDVVVTGNSENEGGGIYNDGGTVYLNNSTVSHNSATYYGGGIYSDGSVYANTSTIADNTAGDYGGGIFGSVGVTEVQNSTVWGNAATNSAGGGLYDEGASLVVVNSTLGANTAPFAPELDTHNSGSNLVIGSSIIQETPSVLGCQVEGSVNDQGHNLSDDASCALGAPTDIVDQPADLDPNGLQYNGGPTATVAPAPGSPAIDAVPAIDCQALDQRGTPRSTPCDVGAYDTDSAPFGPVVSAVTPVTGLTTGGTSVTITGAGFTGATAVDFGSIGAATFTVNSDTSITATAPAESAAVTDVTVTGGSGVSAGVSAISPADQFTYTVPAPPTTAGCSPSCSVTVKTPLNGASITVAGTSTAAFPLAKVDVAVNTGTLSCGAGYNYPAPITKLTPSGFSPTGVLKVTQKLTNQPSLTGVNVCFLAKGASTPKVLTTCGTAKVAPCLLSLSKSASNVVTAKFLSPAKDPRFHVGGPLPTITSFTPSSALPGGKVAIFGSNLTQVSAVVIGGVKAAVKSVTDTKIVVKVPSNARSGLAISLSGNYGLVLTSSALNLG